jgi:uncharacterized membrane protein YphA (DoxX/SURF4 family)
MLEGKMFNSQDRKIHFGLLIMRLGLTAVLFLHALPKLFAGAHSWKSVGTSLGFINIGLPPFRATCILLFIIFGLYFFNYFQIGYNTLMLWSLGLAAVFFGLIYVGPGRYVIAVKLEKK